MSPSRLMRHCAFRTDRYIPCHPRHLSFRRELEERPQKFLLDFPLEPVPSEQCQATPLLVTGFIARVTDVAEGRVEVILWHLPSGSEGETVLDQCFLSDSAQSGGAQSGDLIRFWTWKEIQDGKAISRQFGQILAREEPTPELKEDMARLAEKLKIYLRDGYETADL